MKNIRLMEEINPNNFSLFVIKTIWNHWNQKNEVNNEPKLAQNLHYGEETSRMIPHNLQKQPRHKQKKYGYSKAEI